MGYSEGSQSERRRLLLRTAAELAERVDRTSTYLNAFSFEQLHEYDKLVETMQQKLHRMNALILKNLELLADGDLDVADIDEFEGDLVTASQWFGSIHELLAYLPTQAIRPEAEATIVKAGGLYFAGVQTSMILGSIFNSLEFDFEDIIRRQLVDPHLLETGERRVVQLPMCDAASPTAWAVLAHELGHSVDRQNELTEKVLGRFGGRSAVIQSWCREFIADEISARALGVSPILSILSLHYCFLPRPLCFLPTEQHPALLWRLRAVRELVDSGSADTTLLDQELKDYEATYNFLVERHRKDTPLVSMLPQLTEAAKEVQNAVRQILEDEYGPSSSPVISRHSFGRCVKRLNSRLPIASQGESRPTLRTKLEEFSRKCEEAPEAGNLAFEQLVHAFREEPVELGTILASGQAVRLARVAEFAEKPFTDQQDLRVWLQKMSDLEGLLLKSLSTNILIRGQGAKDREP